jgi:hypothetical protein
MHFLWRKPELNVQFLPANKADHNGSVSQPSDHPTVNQPAKEVGCDDAPTNDAT